MIKIVFCDDDVSVLSEINGLFDRYRAARRREMICKSFQNPFELVDSIERGMQPDILFLDIIMPGENGIHVAEQIRRYDNNVKIIFLTCTPEYAVESYAVDAYYYQIKPVLEEAFFQLMDSVLSECGRQREYNLVIRCKSGVRQINLEKLEYCEVIGRTLLFHLENGNVVESAGSLNELCEKLLVYENFLRPHRSFLINMDYIQTISHKGITMESLEEIPVPHGKCREVKDRYLEYAFRKNQVLI